MKAAINVWRKTNIIWLLLFIGAMGNVGNAQNVAGCDPLGVNPTVDYKLTYDAATNRYTAWYVPSDNTLHRLVTGQFTIIAPNGFTTPGATGRDANFQITNLNGIWTDFVTDDEFITNAGQTTVPTLNRLAVHQVGMAPTATDVDPDGTGPLTSDAPVVAGQAVPLFSFPGTDCASLLRILVNGEPLQSQLLSKFGFNLNHDLSIQLPRDAFVAAYQRYCKNDAASSVSFVLPDIQNDAATLCASTATYANNYFTQVLRNWNATTLPAGTFEVKASNRQWAGFTISPSSMSANVSIDPVTGAYTLTFPTDGQGNTVPGSLTICNTIQDVCQTASDQACVVLTWHSSGQLAINNVAPVCLTGGTATVSLTATSGFASYSWSGPGLTSASTNPALATLTTAGNYSYTVVASNGTSCSTVATTSVAVVNCGTDLSLIKTGPTTVDAGASVSYNLVITNNGPSAANGATVMDPTTANFTVSGVACSGASAGTTCPIAPTVASLQSGLAITTLPAGGSLTLVVTGTAGATGSIVNVATVTTPAGTTDTSPANNSGTATTSITPAPVLADLSLIKTGPATVNAGASVSYNLVITNNGPNAANGATVVDPTTANFTATGVACSGASAGTTCPVNPTVASLQGGLTITTLPAGGSLTLVVTGTAGASGSIVNVATVTTPSGTTDTNPANNSGTATTSITPAPVLADLSLTKTGPATVNAGASVSYNLVITNNGPSAANGATVMDPSTANFTATGVACSGTSAGTTCPVNPTVASLQSGLTITTLPAGGSLTLVVTGTAGASGSIVNVATVTTPSGTTDTNPANNSGTATTSITPAPVLADLSLIKTGPATVNAGASVSYNLVITNNGPSAANGATIADPATANFTMSGVSCVGASAGTTCPVNPTVASLQSGLAIATLPAGGSLTLVVTGTAGATGSIINVATVTTPTGTTDTNPANNSGTATTSITPAPVLADLSLTKTGPATVNAGASVSYNLVITNNGPSAANGATVIDPTTANFTATSVACSGASAGTTCPVNPTVASLQSGLAIATLPAGGSLALVVTGTAGASGLIVNVATVTTPNGTTDTNPANNSGTATTSIIPTPVLADLSLIKTGPATVNAGASVSYNLVITNNGPSAANGATIADPATANFIMSGVSCMGASAGTTCPVNPTVASLQSGLTITILPAGGSLTLVVTGIAGATGSIINVATVTTPTGTTDTNPANNSGTATTSITPAPVLADLSLTKTGPATVNAGASVSYNLVITNNGPSAANGTTIIDPATANFTMSGVSCAGASAGTTCPVNPTVASLQSGLAITTLPAGGSLTLVVTGTAGATGSIINVATVTTPTGTTDTNPANNSGTATTSITIPCPSNLIVLGTSHCNDGTYSVNYIATQGTTILANAGNTTSAGVISGIPAGIVLSVTATNGLCTQVSTANPPAGCVPCVAPMLTLCNPACSEKGGFTFTYLTNGGVVSVSNGATVDAGNHTISVPAGVTAVVVTATSSVAGCDKKTSFAIAAPTGCNPSGCTTPTLFVCQPVCNGDGTYSVGYLVSPGASVTANVGVFSAGNRITVPVGTKLTVTASNGPNCSASIMIESPASCSTCVQPTFGVSGIVCRNNGANYDVQYITNTTSGTVTASAGVVSGSVITGIPTGQSVVLTLKTNSCPPVSIIVAAPTDCKPSTVCVTMDLKVLLEGPYNSTTHLMNTVLNSRGLLPGQSPIGMFAVSTPAGQPYNTAPWNYTGTESMTTYPTDIVDWVLVSLRTDSLSTNTVFRAAGLLHSDGRITFTSPCFAIPDGKYFPVIEHRNHMGVMASGRVPIVNSKLIFDFTAQDSYTATDPPSFGEIRIDNRWMMYGAEGKKDAYTENFDINFFDSKLWKDESGIFDQYRTGDFNMDADVNFSDSVLWNKNNGRYSKVPH